MMFGQNHTSKWFNADNGLSQNSIKDIIKDKYGFIWLTTENGILRYDGNKFQSFEIKGLTNMHFKYFQGDIFKDSIISVNAEQESAVLITKRTIKQVSNKLVKNYESKKGILYNRLFKNLQRTEAVSAFDYYTIKTSKGFYHFGKDNTQFQSTDDNTQNILDQKIDREALTMLFVHGEHVFVGDTKNRKTTVFHNGKSYYINGKTLYNDPQSRIYWNEINNQVFVINNGTIYISNYNKGKLNLKKLLDYKDFDYEFYYTMYYDEKYNKLYLGTLTKGLNIVTITNFNTILRNKPFDDNVFYSALPYSESSVITPDGNEYYKDKNITIFEEAFYDKYSIIYDRSDNILYVSDYNIQKRLKKEGYKKAESILYPNINVLYIFNTEDLYAASVRGGFNHYLYIFENDNFKKIRNKIQFKTSVLSIEKIGDILYVGCRDGLYKVSISKNKILTKIIDNVVVRQVFRSSKGDLWITTSNHGFYLIKNNQAIRMPEDRDKFLSQAHFLLEDKNSNIWISSNNGLFKIRKEMLLDHSNNKNNKITYYRFTKEYGFSTNEFNGGGTNPGNKLKNGEFVFPSLEGLVFFKPESVKTYFPYKGQLSIESGTVNNEVFRFDKKLQLKSNYENLIFNVDLPYFYNIENIHLDAKLDGQENTLWERIPNTRQYTLRNNLKPGEYKLTFRYLISEQGEYAYKTIPITIIPFFYQTTWFKLCCIFLILIITATILYRRRKLMKELEIKTHSLETTSNQLKNQTYYQKELLNSISHDIATPLKFITGLSKELKNSNDLETQKRYFESISKSSEQLYKFTRELRKYSELFSEDNINSNGEFELYSLLEEKILLFEEIGKQKGLRLENLSDADIKLNLNRNILGAILHNLIDNAIKYTEEGDILIETVNLKDSIQIKIKDTGNEMSEEQLNYYTLLSMETNDEHGIYKNFGLGLHMVIQLIKKINAKIEFNKNTPKGTVVIINILKENV